MSRRLRSDEPERFGVLGNKMAPRWMQGAWHDQGVIGIAPPDDDRVIEEGMPIAASQVGLYRRVERTHGWCAVPLRLNERELLPLRQVACEVEQQAVVRRSWHQHGKTPPFCCSHWPGGSSFSGITLTPILAVDVDDR